MNDTQKAQNAMPWASDVVCFRTWRKERVTGLLALFVGECSVSVVVLMFRIGRHSFVVRAETLPDAIDAAEQNRRDWLAALDSPEAHAETAAKLKATLEGGEVL